MRRFDTGRNQFYRHIIQIYIERRVGACASRNGFERNAVAIAGIFIEHDGIFFIRTGQGDSIYSFKGGTIHHTHHEGRISAGIAREEAHLQRIDVVGECRSGNKVRVAGTIIIHVHQLGSTMCIA